MQPMHVVMVNTVQTSKCGGLETYTVNITVFTEETGVFFLRFPPDLLLVFELSGVLAREIFDTDFTNVGIRLTFGNGVPPTDFLALELTNGAFLLVTNDWKFNQTTCLLFTRITKSIQLITDQFSLQTSHNSEKEKNLIFIP